MLAILRKRNVSGLMLRSPILYTFQFTGAKSDRRQLRSLLTLRHRHAGIVAAHLERQQPEIWIEVGLASEALADRDRVAVVEAFDEEPVGVVVATRRGRRRRK